MRFIVIIDPIDRSARVEALDDAARVLARSEGTDMILLPVDGPLCVPEKCTLSIRLATDDAPLTGLVAVLTSA